MVAQLDLERVNEKAKVFAAKHDLFQVLFREPASHSDPSNGQSVNNDEPSNDVMCHCPDHKPDDPS